MPRKAPSPPFDRRRWTEQDARAALAALQRSGKPVGVFAAEHGLDPQRLYSWRRRLGEAERTTFRELIVRPSPRSSVTDSDAPFEVVLPSGVVLRVPASFEAAALERLLEVLRTGAC
jgi:transposase-like protein